MNQPPNNDPQRKNNGQGPYPFNPSQQDPWQSPPAGPSQGPYPPLYQGAYPPPPPPIPGQFYPLPSQPPGKTSSPYKKKVLFTLIGAYIAFWLFVFIAGASSQNGFAIFLGNLGISLFWGVLVSALILDWRGFFTINGWIQWQKGKRAKYVFLGLLCLLFSPIVLGIYFVRVFLAQRQASQQGLVAPGSTPSPSRRPGVGIIVGIIVTLCALFIYSVGTTSGNTGNTTTVSPKSSSTIAQRKATNPTPKATQVTTRPTIAPTKVLPPTPTKAPTPIPTRPPAPTAPPAPKPTPAPIAGVNGNPWGYNFQVGTLIYNPPSTFCTYFDCIASFGRVQMGTLMNVTTQPTPIQEASQEPVVTMEVR